MKADKLRRFKKILLEMRERLTGEVEHVVEAIQEDVAPSGNLSAAPVHLADVAPESIDADVVVLDTERNLLEEVELALFRINDGTFGKCERCGGSVSEMRLEALPYAALCIECARVAEVEEPATSPLSSGGPEERYSSGGKRQRRLRAGQKLDELGPGEHTNELGDTSAAGTPGGGLAAGGLAGTNAGDGSPENADLENAMGCGIFDNSGDTASDSEPQAGRAGGAVGGTPAGKRRSPK